ncbi:uncharacterized protein LOC109843869 isoform X2 [Asparagus officinalis]|uniref:uncharacterized protein LOC109843869 isoform X2 n=1 Tax=Asparagus officinalis TaxID=4686 RepID=UPI00098DFD6C|nr:uncharacterized protein LOC109843869 isoform X2 [Asparagus officinalis]
MEKKQKILESRERLDKTLALPDLVNEDSIKSLVKNQLLRSCSSREEGNMGNVIEKRAMEVANFLEMLRSASEDQKAVKVHDASQKEWKVKQDTDQLRVMYREGPHGTPFHTLLAEGYVDGPIDVCLCVSWETTLYKKWWPQYNIPTFKITSSVRLKKVCVGEEISLIRVKVAWPVSDREILLHFFEIEYFKEDLIIISDTENIDVNTHGFNSDGIPEAKETVRVDLVGGFVLQKVGSNRSYFRVIANMDIKLDFVPPTLINFISRQLIGSGHKLYSKAVRSVATTDEDYRPALQGPMYARIREALDAINKIKTDSVISDEEKHEALAPEVKGHSDASSTEVEAVSEIVEEETEQNEVISNEAHVSKEDSSTDTILSADEIVSKGNIFVSPEVEHALRTVDMAIAVLRGRGFSGSNQSDCFSINQKIPPSDVVNSSPNIKEDTTENSINNRSSPGAQVTADAGDFRRNSAPRAANHDDQSHLTLSKERILALDEKSTAEITTLTQPPVSESMRKVCVEENLRSNGFHQMDNNRDVKSRNKKKKQGVCCVNLSLFRS